MRTKQAPLPPPPQYPVVLCLALVQDVIPSAAIPIAPSAGGGGEGGAEQGAEPHAEGCRRLWGDVGTGSLLSLGHVAAAFRGGVYGGGGLHTVFMGGAFLRP